ncbi:unnamed protein product [Calypogeia fissa]
MQLVHTWGPCTRIAYNNRLETIEPLLVTVESNFAELASDTTVSRFSYRFWCFPLHLQTGQTDIELIPSYQEGRLLFETRFWLSRELHLFGFLFTTNFTQHLMFGRNFSSLLRRMWLEGTMKAAT